MPSDLWLIDPVFKNKKVIVEISGRASGKWQGGEQDGTIGYVTSVFDPRNDSTSRTAQFVPLHANNDSAEALTVPIEYLIPVNPKTVQDHAIILDGAKKGHEVVLREEVIFGTWTVGPYRDPGAALYDCPGDRMVKVYKS